jgi:hypothetical protein
LWVYPKHGKCWIASQIGSLQQSQYFISQKI